MKAESMRTAKGFYEIHHEIDVGLETKEGCIRMMELYSKHQATNLIFEWQIHLNRLNWDKQGIPDNAEISKFLEKYKGHKLNSTKY